MAVFFVLEFVHTLFSFFESLTKNLNRNFTEISNLIDVKGNMKTNLGPSQMSPLELSQNV